MLGLVPGLWAMGRTLQAALGRIWTHSHSTLWPYAAGIGGYLVFERLAFHPLRLYVFGHELTHAISCVLSGGRVYGFRASSKGGHVRLSKTGVWIALSPYCVPFYTLLILLSYRVLNVWWDLSRYHWVLQILLGASFAFHLSLTVFALRCHQPDLRVLGWLPSLSVIIMANGLCLSALLVWLFPGLVRTGELARAFGSGFSEAVKSIFLTANELWLKVRY